MAVGISNFNETENFDEYNPHPYQGGYDITLTYGNPLPPISAICYPMSDASSHPPPPQKLPLPSVTMEPPASPEASERAISTSVGREDDPPEADYGSSYGYGDQGFASADWWWNTTGFSPFPMNGLGGCRCDAEDMRYWGPLRRAADYLFGYSQGFGERIIGVDSYGIPIYFYKMHGSDPVNVEIQPAMTETLEYHDDSEKWSSTYNNLEDEDNRLGFSAHSYLKHHSEESFDAEIDPVESVFSWKPSRPELYDEVPLTYSESSNGVNLNGNLELFYDKRYHGGAQHVQLEAVESSFQRLSYHEASQEFSYTDSNWEASYGNHGDEKNRFTDAYQNYGRQDYQQPRDGELEPYMPTWARYPGYYGISEEDAYAGSQLISHHSEVYNESYSSPHSAWPTSSLGERGNEDNLSSIEYAYQTHHDGHSLELEPFKPTWMLNPNYYGSY